jgi:hypothetical protein
MDLDDESGLQQAGQAMQTPEVKSGVHAQAVVTQVIIGLSDLRQNIERAFQRSWRIRLQLTRAYFEQPQRLDYIGEGGQHKEKSWTGSDVGSTKDVRIERGTFTQLAPTQKDALTFEWLQAGMVTPEEAQRLTRNHTGALVGSKEHPALLRVERQIATWREGPPETWQPIPPQPVTDPLGIEAKNPDGSPVMEQQPDPILQGLFPANPADEAPEVALIRFQELSRAMQDVKADRWGPEWFAALAQAYEAARQAAGVMTVREQQEMAAQQAQAEQQAVEAERQAKIQEKQIDADAKAAEQRIKSAEAVEKTEAQAAERSRTAEVKANEKALTTGKR